MTDEAGFLNRLAAFPADKTTRLVYADWLDEQNDPACAAKAAFLRVTCQLLRMPRKSKGMKQLKKRRQALAATLPTDWLAVVSHLPVENCRSRREPSGQSTRISLDFEFVCGKRWEDMRVTDDNAVRFCEGCRQEVYYCDTIMGARRHARVGHCVAVDCGIERKPRDLQPPPMLLGKVLPNSRAYQRITERSQPDPVSVERERQRRERGEGD
ncbi:TIGR02996 domain-containing protein [Fimbriiglobus ruber]|uniref:TIGR02996 domain-containing protein n=1 Tax=Fimbriiglobus ruber TaxID=1908690 RepID=A0A225DAQ0_9BACT|nr:TIGR02996 domain-containing protein [Fimbriiglobus ruber]OWK38650.1 hypothetical protein FRUB_07770 [Fimbriiglobus ruber]